VSGPTVADALRAATARLPGDEARHEAERLLGHALGRPRSWLFVHATDPVDGEALARLDALVARRAAGEPVAYLVGRRGFWTLDLVVTADTLVPRPETETLVEEALARLPAGPVRVLDLGTGTGAIALAIGSERPDADVTAVDASAGALAVAARNAHACGVRVRLLAGDWFAPVAGQRFAMIVSNPPYLATDDPHRLAGDLRFEPLAALVSGADGLDAIRAIAAAAPTHLEPGGWLLVEHGWTQGEAVRAIFGEAGLVEVGTARDLEGRERATRGRRPAGR
jgi:release factor glutamine methyltransferase